jgi:cell surface protein SprA
VKNIRSLAAYILLVFFLVVITVIQGCKKDDPEPENQWPEGSVPMIDFLKWSLSSTPSLFPESSITGNLGYGKNRAKLCWYNIDPIFSKGHPEKPPNITDEELSKPYIREVFQSEIHFDYDPPEGIPDPIKTMNLNFYPSLRGPYNYDAFPSAVSAGMDPNGNLASPETRWGGIMRTIPPTGFDLNYVEFWMLDPFIGNENLSGDLYINLGNFNEDILRDNHVSNEASISQEPSHMDTTDWCLAGKYNKWKDTFGTAEGQDFGLDGLDNTGETDHFNSFLQDVYDYYGQGVLTKILHDPSADDYHYYRGTDYDNWTPASQVHVRYQMINGLQGNSRPDHLSPENYPVSITHKPDTEDIDNSDNLNFTESYKEYHISIRQGDFEEGSNYISEIRSTVWPLPNGTVGNYKWYYFKIPVDDFTDTYGNPLSFSNFDMIRVSLTGFSEPVTIRLAYFYLSEE